MQLSQSVTYAIQALLLLAKRGEGAFVSRGQLAAQGAMPERFLLEILRELVRHRILRSTWGGGGGFALARHPGAISLLDVVEAVDGPLPAGVPATAGMPPLARDWLQNALEQVAQARRQRLSAITLDRLTAECAALPSGSAGSLRGLEEPRPSCEGVIPPVGSIIPVASAFARPQ